jgi:methylglutaconyl-CoA hydratase
LVDAVRMSTTLLSVERRQAVEYVSLNRPDARNAFNPQLIEELGAWAGKVRGAAARGELRVAVLAGTGATFSAGADVAWMSSTVALTEDENIRDAAAMSQMFSALDELPVPLIGRIHGAALGGGAGLAAVCDVVVAAADALFGFTEVKLGILPAVVSPFVLAKIGASAARELFLTGARFPASRAREIGLVHAVVPPADLDEAVTRYVEEFLSAAPGAIAAAKALIPAVAGRGARDVSAVTARAIATRRVSAEGQEGLRAFLAKRKPSWAE